MTTEATNKELRGLRTWMTAIRTWQSDAAEILADHALTTSGFGVLLALAEGPRRSGELRDELGMTTGGMAKLLKRLEDEGRIVREHATTDQRVVIVTLTDAGMSVLRHAGAELIAMREADYRKWDVDEELVDAIHKAWQKIQDAAARQH